jgi:predicted nucleic acid-binding protein
MAFLMAEVHFKERRNVSWQTHRKKRKRKQIDLADLFIAATAVSHQLLFATLNRKHFDRIDELIIIE